MNFNELRAGSEIEVDARRLFFGDPVWVQATFLRWESGKYLPGVMNTAIVQITDPKYAPAPMIKPLGNGEFMVFSPDIRLVQGNAK